jgi:hypothetical protein
MAHLTGSIGYPQQTSEVTSYSSETPAKIELGTRARDKSGNEFIYVDFTQALQLGELCTILSDNTVAETAAATQGRIGVVCSTVASSDLAGWVQVYGLNEYCLATSGVTTGPMMLAATTDGLGMPLLATTGGNQIIGFTLVTAPSTATSPSSITGVASVFLNYPYTHGIFDVMTS